MADERSPRRRGRRGVVVVGLRRRRPVARPGCVRRPRAARQPLRLLGRAGARRRAVPVHRGARRHRPARRASRSSRRRCGRTTCATCRSRQWSLGNEAHGVLLDDPHGGVAPGARHARAGDVRRRVVRRRRRRRSLPIDRSGYGRPARSTRGSSSPRGCWRSRARPSGCTCGACRTCQHRSPCRRRRPWPAGALSSHRRAQRRSGARPSGEWVARSWP